MNKTLLITLLVISPSWAMSQSVFVAPDTFPGADFDAITKSIRDLVHPPYNSGVVEHEFVTEHWEIYQEADSTVIIILQSITDSRKGTGRIVLREGKTAYFYFENEDSLGGRLDREAFYFTSQGELLSPYYLDGEAIIKYQDKPFILLRYLSAISSRHTRVDDYRSIENFPYERDLRLCKSLRLRLSYLHESSEDPGRWVTPDRRTTYLADPQLVFFERTVVNSAGLEVGKVNILVEPTEVLVAFMAKGEASYTLAQVPEAVKQYIVDYFSNLEKVTPLKLKKIGIIQI